MWILNFSWKNIWNEGCGMRCKSLILSKLKGRGEGEVMMTKHSKMHCSPNGQADYMSNIFIIKRRHLKCFNIG